MKSFRAVQTLTGLFLILAISLGLSMAGNAQSFGTSPIAAEAEDAPVIDSTMTESEFQALLGSLSDEQVRDILIAQYADLSASRDAAPQSDLLNRLRDSAKRALINLQTILGTYGDLGTGFGAIHMGLEAAGGIWGGLLAFLICAVGGWILRFLWRHRAARHTTALAERNKDKKPYATIGIICDASLFLIIELSGVVAFAVAAHAILYVTYSDPNLHLFVSGYIAILTVLMIVRAILDLLFPINWAVYRIVAISDRATKVLHYGILWLAFLWMFELTTSHLMVSFGAPDGTDILFSMICSVIWLITSVAGLSILNHTTRNMLPPRDGQAEGSGIADAITRNWATLGTLFFISTWILFAGGGLVSGNVDAAAKAIFQLTLLLLIFWTAYRVLIHYLRAQDLSYEISGAVGRTARAALLAVGIVLALSILGVAPEELNNSGVMGAIIKAGINVFLTILIGWAVWDFVRTVIDARIAAEDPGTENDAPAEGEGGLGASRTATLLPLLRSSALAIIGMTSLFVAASSLGVNVAPLIAGAGVVGLAIGFGAQTLVKDIVSGIFFLIDDAFRRGEYIDLGSVKGTVERISVRSLQLRHHLGAVHTIPFGEITALTNYSRDWVIMKLPLRLTFDTDPTKVKKLIKRIGAEFMENEEIGKGLLEPPKSQGVIQMEDSAMILRVKFKAIPGKQFVIRRELLHRIRAVFEEEGIRFANREVTVRVNEGASDADKRDAAGAAALQHVDEQAQSPG